MVDLEFRRRVDAVFDHVAELPADERAAWLDERVSDAAIRAAVERLLEQMELEELDTGDLLAVGDAAAESLLHEPAQPETPPTIGTYRVLDRIGSGGMGDVYLAEQSDPRRRVAVKVMRAGTLSAQARRRFEQEAELLGRLQHPGIAQVIEFGRSDEGQTYLVMEFIDGERLTDYAASQDLDQADRLALLADIADAVHHAHLRGVIHRDLKPANVLVTSEGQVKVIDFGVARNVEVQDDGTLRTSVGQLVGTLGYMSPEQLQGDSLAVDTRSDTYTLGVIAYELLGGRLPHDIARANFTEAVRIVIEQDPPSLGRIEPSCRGDLEIIVAKALEKDRERRYPSASAFADDLRRYLGHEPIRARRPSLAYSVSKLARRHRIAFTFAAATILSTVVGAGIAVVQAIEYRALADRELLARLAAEEQEQAALAAQDEAERLASLASERADEIERRADPGRLVLAVAEAEELWPALPSTVPAIDAWLRRYAEPLSANLPKHRAVLELLQSRALPYSEEMRQRDFDEHPLVEEQEILSWNLEAIRRQIAGNDPMIGPVSEDRRLELEADLPRLEAEIADVEERRRTRLTWAFEDPVLQEQHDHLQGLVAGLSDFVAPNGIVADVESRRARALRVEAETVRDPGPSAKWVEAADDIRALAVYGGLELAPQVGMLPLRRDPESGLWEFWVHGSGDIPSPSESTDAPNPWSLDRGTGIVMVLIPGGQRTLGAQAEDPDAPQYDALATPTEGLPRTVDVPAFFISKFELTQSQWILQTGDNPSLYGPIHQWSGSPPRDEPICTNTAWNPVESVSLVEAIDVLRRFGLRVPSGDEWEVAARGGSDGPWWTGPDLLSLQGAVNVADGAVQRLGGPANWDYTTELEDRWSVHAPVGTFRANAFGLHDVLGNVWEWVVDEHMPGTAPTRGGSYEHSAYRARATSVEFGQRTSKSRFVGVRPARSVQPARD
ncbi:MAG: protein kinase [Planctomycetota bacterium]